MTTKIAQANTSRDGRTTKMLVELQDKQRVEAVIMRFTNTTADGEEKNRVTLCISSQVGCQMGCTFCATGTMGLTGNLSAGEICEQVVHATRVAGTEIRNIVFMGMGEPLHNYEAVRTAIQTIVKFCPGIIITVSTVGIVPKMRQLIRELPYVQLALSLHAPTQELRTTIVPSGKAYKLDQIMNVVDEYVNRGRRRALIEYVMLKDVNDSNEVAEELGLLLKDRNVTLNLIPYNPTDVGTQYKAPAGDRTQAFLDIIRGKHGVFTTIRQEMGQDIAGACGQLALKNGPACSSDGSCTDSEEVKHKTGVSDIEDLMSGSTVESKQRVSKNNKSIRRRGVEHKDISDDSETSQQHKNTNTKQVSDDKNKSTNKHNTKQQQQKQHSLSSIMIYLLIFVLLLVAALMISKSVIRV